MLNFREFSQRTGWSLKASLPKNLEVGQKAYLYIYPGKPEDTPPFFGITPSTATNVVDMLDTGEIEVVAEYECVEPYKLKRNLYPNGCADMFPPIVSVRERGAQPGSRNAAKETDYLQVFLSLDQKRRQKIIRLLISEGEEVTNETIRDYARRTCYAALDRLVDAIIL